ncbi:MAG: hypothetical protein IVW57_03190 [Ktedonobacterales bacterium]|nr:hypothetical protein [Ktedonobacterales bacterium]
MSNTSSPVTSTTTTKLSRGQRRILFALASRPAARIKHGGYGLYLTDGHGWVATDLRLRAATISALVRLGWLREQRDSIGRTEWALTTAGREAVTE